MSARGRSYGHFPVGERFGRWVVVDNITRVLDPPVNGARHEYLERVRCDCGTERVLSTGRLRSGQSLGCGCGRAEQVARAALKHGQSRTPLYRLWAAIKHRLTHDRHYEGVMMDPAWTADFVAFHAFITQELGPKPTPEHSLDRVDGSRGYEPGNVRWATPTEQSRNRSFERMRGPERRQQHGRTGTPIHGLWKAVKQRLEFQRGYEGVALHEPWRHDFLAFEQYILSLGPKPTPQHTLDRIENAKGYEPGNLRWASKSEQSQNRKNAVERNVDAKAQEAVGQRFGRLVVTGIKLARRHGHDCFDADVTCDCGVHKVVAWTVLLAGRTRSCGCGRSDNLQRGNYANAVMIEARGETLPASEWARRLGTSVQTVLQRMKSGWEPHLAATQPVAEFSSCTIDGVTRTVSAWRRLNGIPQATVSKRIRVLGWDAVRAVTEPAGRGRRPYKPPTEQ